MNIIEAIKNNDIEHTESEIRNNPELIKRLLLQHARTAEMVKLLIDLGADSNQLDDSGNNLIYSVISKFIPDENKEYIIIKSTKSLSIDEAQNLGLGNYKNLKLDNNEIKSLEEYFELIKYMFDNKILKKENIKIDDISSILSGIKLKYGVEKHNENLNNVSNEKYDQVTNLLFYVNGCSKRVLSYAKEKLIEDTKFRDMIDNQKNKPYDQSIEKS